MSSSYKRKKSGMSVPGATVALYIVMVIVILGICAAVFFFFFDPFNFFGASDGGSAIGSGSYIVPNDESSGSPDESSSDNESSDLDSSDSESSSDTQDTQSGTASSTGGSSSSRGSSSDSQSSSSAQTGSSSSGTAQPTSFSKDFFKDDLFIGDSIFTGLYGYSLIDPENVAAEQNYTPSKAIDTALKTHGVSALEYAKQRSPKRIFIMIGINGLSSSGLSSLKSSYSNLLTTLKSELPNTKICCISITPAARVNDYPNVDNSDVRAMNEYIQQQCKALGVDYYDFCSTVSDSEGYFDTDYAAKDGLHFNATTYRVLLSALQKKYS